MKRTTIFFAALLATPLFAAEPDAVVGKFAAGERYVEPMRDAPPSVSRMFVRAVKSADAASVELPATGGGGLIVLMLPVGGRAAHVSSKAKLKTPAGDTFGANEWGSSDIGVQRFVVDAAEELGLDLHGAAQEVIHVDRTVGASYRLSVPETRDAGGVLVVAGEPDSNLTLTTSAGPLSRHDGEPVTLRATLHDGDRAITGATVTARLGAPGARTGDAIALFDDGAHGDGAANDGEYAAVLRELPSASSGFWSVRYDADGVTATGVPFARSGSSGFMNEPTRARLQRDSVEATITDGVLHLRAKADVIVDGSYRFDVIVASHANAKGERNGIAWGEAVRALPPGTRELTLDVPVGAVDLDSLFLDVRLLSLDSFGVAGRVTIDRAAK